jgi:hypothetical protein
VVFLAALVTTSGGQVNAATVLAAMPGIGVIITGFLFMAIASVISLLAQIEHNTAYAADTLDRIAGGSKR